MMISGSTCRSMVRSKLFLDGKNFQLQDSSKNMEEMLKTQSRFPGSEIREYGITFKKINPETGQATVWEKCDGLSLWIP